MDGKKMIETIVKTWVLKHKRAIVIALLCLAGAKIGLAFHSNQTSLAFSLMLAIVVCFQGYEIHRIKQTIKRYYNITSVVVKKGTLSEKDLEHITSWSYTDKDGKQKGVIKQSYVCENDGKQNF